jgi:hypothetical protein
MKQLPEAGRELPHKKGEQRRVINKHNTRSNKNSQAMPPDGTVKQVKHKVKVNPKPAAKKPMTSENAAKSNVAMVSYPGTTQNSQENQLSAAAKPFVPSPPKLPRSADRAVYNVHRGWITNDESERLSAMTLLKLAAGNIESPSKASMIDVEAEMAFSPASVVSEYGAEVGSDEGEEFIKVQKKKSPGKKKKNKNPSSPIQTLESTPTTARKLYKALDEAAGKEIIIVEETKSPGPTTTTVTERAASPKESTSAPPKSPVKSPPPVSRKTSHHAEAATSQDEVVVVSPSNVKHVSTTYGRETAEPMAMTPLKPRVSLSPGEPVITQMDFSPHKEATAQGATSPDPGLTHMSFSPAKEPNETANETAEPNAIFQPVIAPATTLDDDDDNFTVLTKLSMDTVGGVIEPQTPQRNNAAIYRRTHRNVNLEEDEVEEVSIPPYVTPTTIRELPKVTTAIPRDHYTYCDISIKLHSAKDERKELFRAVGQVVRDMVGANNTLAFFPFTKADREIDKRCISDSKSWNTIMSTKQMMYMQRFFRDANPRRDARGKTTVHVLIGSDTPFESWYANVAHLFAGKEKDANKLYKRQLQTEFPVCVGWLYRSHGAIDCTHLQRETTKILGFPVGMKWRKIYSGRNGRELKDDMQAVHVEVQAEHAKQDSAALRELFHAMREDGFPLGMELRFIADITQLNDNPEDEQNAEALWIKQYEFINTIIQVNSTIIQSPDKPLAALEGSTLRDYIMALRWSNDCRVPLVLGINRTFRFNRYSKGLPTEQGWTVTLVPQASVEGKAVIKGLIPKLIYELHANYHEEILSVFDPTERGQATTNKWDPKTRTSTDPSSQQMATVLKREKMKFDLSEMEKHLPVTGKHLPWKEEEGEKKKEKTEILGSISIGEDSIGTVGNPNAASKPRKRASKPLPENAKTWQKTLVNNQAKKPKDDTADNESTEIPNGTSKAGKSSGDITTEDWADDDTIEDIDRETWDGIDDSSEETAVEPPVPPPQPAPDEGPKGPTIRKDHVS